MAERRVYAGKAGRWDARRNTSARRPPPPGSGAELVAELARRSDEPWYRWIADGRPPLTESEYAAHQRAGKGR